MNIENFQATITIAMELGITTFGELANLARFNGCKSNADLITMLYRLREQRRQKMNAQ